MFLLAGFVGMAGEQNLQEKGGYRRRISRSHLDAVVFMRNVKIKSDE
jgi:hypothetical protein